MSGPAPPLDALRRDLLACRRCLQAGYAIVPGAVFTHPPRQTPVMLIGQAPGVTEVEARRPFNAGSGTRLFSWLKQAGWREDDFRSQFVMTAVTKCFPGKDKNGKGDRVPSKAEQRLCRPFLEREITLFRPRLMIPVGGLAIKLFYPAHMKLNQIIGSAAYFPPETLSDPLNLDISRAELLTAYDPPRNEGGRWVVPLPHPSGASLWPNKAQNRRLIDRALQILAYIRAAWGL